jgi:hypothetical protein
MPKPVCIKCQRFFRPHRCGISVLEGKPVMEGIKPGTEDAAFWAPYKVWRADRYKCNGCGTEILVGFGFAPVWQDYHQAEMPESDYKVNDC